MKREKRYLTLLGFGALAAVILAMMAATILEKARGSSVAFHWVYHNPLFFVGWAATAVSGLCLVFAKAARHFWTLLLHGALVVILGGALLTHLTGEQGQVLLPQGESVDVWVRDDGVDRPLPCPLTLESFEVLYHDGSGAPADYRSRVRAEGSVVEISMNHIARIHGYRLMQAGFGEDASILIVNHDPWGIGLSYTGFALLLLSLLGFFFQKDTVFRKTLAKVLQSSAFLLLFLLPTVAEARPMGLAEESPLPAEKAFHFLSQPRVPFMVSLTWGLLLFILLGIRLSRGKGFPRVLTHVSFGLACLLLAYLTLTLSLYWYLSGHAPFAGSYCVMMLMAWLSSLGICLSWKKFPIVLPLGFLLAGFAMLVASLSGANLQITPLMPVLQSPLLSFHVLSMMISYTLLGMVALNGILGLVVADEASARLRDISLVLLYPAVFLLMGGTFLGAVWANISWGNYWNWDPKETWALVTFLVYSFALHGSQLKPFGRPRFFHAFCVGAFLCVLITYFGVNLALGGMHAYA